MIPDWVGPVFGSLLGCWLVWRFGIRKPKPDPNVEPDPRMRIANREWRQAHRMPWLSLREQRDLEVECGIEPSDLVSVRSTWYYEDPVLEVSTRGSSVPVDAPAKGYSVTHWGEHSPRHADAPEHCRNCKDLLEIVTPDSRRYDCGCGQCSATKPRPVDLQKKKQPCPDPEYTEVTDFTGAVLQRIEQCGCGECYNHCRPGGWHSNKANGEWV